MASIFSKVVSFFDDIRINMGFGAYEAYEREQHISRANRRYSTKELDRDIAARLTPYEDEAKNKFNVPEALLKNSRASSCREIESLENKISVLERDYKGELDDLYVQKQYLCNEIEQGKQDLNTAFTELNSAKASLDSWYAKSERSFFGNKGKKLPSHSFFGQSIGDRDGYKYDIEKAKRKIGPAKENINRLKVELTHVCSSINNLKALRDEMYALKREGYKVSALSKKLDLERQKVLSLDVEIDVLNKEREEFFKAAKHRTGCVELEEKILDILLLKSAYLNEFDSEQARELRRIEHRQLWREKHNRC